MNGPATRRPSSLNRPSLFHGSTPDIRTDSRTDRLSRRSAAVGVDDENRRRVRTCLSPGASDTVPNQYGTASGHNTHCNTVPIWYAFDMSILDRIIEIAADQHGYITARQATDAEIPAVELRKLAQRGRLDHPAHGLYRVAAFPRRANDEFMEATLWADGRGVISHESALALWELADINPARIHVTVPPPYRPRKQGGSTYRIWTRSIPSDQIDYVDGIPTVTPERAILDAARSGVQRRFIEQAIVTARNRQLFGRETEARIRGALDGRSQYP